MEHPVETYHHPYREVNNFLILVSKITLSNKKPVGRQAEKRKAAINLARLKFCSGWKCWGGWGVFN